MIKGKQPALYFRCRLSFIFILISHPCRHVMKTKLLLIILCLLMRLSSTSQCTTLGQTPSTAFPVCGTTVFQQTTVPICSTNSLYVPGCSGNGSANYANKNPFWYRFTCYESGTLGFLITPNDMADDYDWQLYDVTGLNPDEVFTNRNIIVTGNWAGNPGTTGTTAGGVNYIQCASSYTGTESRYAKMPTLIKGHTYILLVSHFSDSQSGYKLSFGGGTAVITDPTDPKMSTVTPSCDGSKLYLKLNKKMRCASIATDGSDFGISMHGIGVLSASGVNCSNSFDTDSILINLSAPLPPGNYNLSIRNGSDSNTILDNCNRQIPEDDFLPFTVLPLQPTPLNKMITPTCAPRELVLVFEKPIRCNSIEPGGSDFAVTGPSGVQVIGASGNCKDSVTSTITIQLDKPIVHGGNYIITLKPGLDGTTIVDACGQVTPAGQSVNFSLKDTVSADFGYQVGWGCKTDTIQCFHPGNNGITEWQWQMDYAGASSLQNPVAYFNTYGNKLFTLKVTNGFCSDSVTKTILLDNELKAQFETNNTICPEDSAVFKNSSIGKIISYDWDFANGFTSADPDPLSQKYPLIGIERIYNIRLIVQNDQCADTLIQPLKVLNSCFIAVPNAFTPNNDGLNDFLYPLNAFKADKMKFKVYNRAGLLVFSSSHYGEKWDGYYKGEPQDPGVFAWTLEYIHRDTGKHFRLKGSTLLIR